MPIYKFNPQGARDPVTFVLVALNLIIGLADAFSGEVIGRASWQRGIDVYYGQLWRPFTSGFVHLNWMHLAMNCYSLWVLGKLVEPLFGRSRYLIIYFTALFGGSGLTLVFNDPITSGMGASGAIFGVFGALLGYLFARAGSWRGVWETAYGRQLIIVLMVNAAFSLMPGISFLGHLGGFVPGVVLGIYFEREYRRDASIYDRATVALIVALIAGLLAYGCFPINKSAYHATQALKAYESGNLQRGDELLEHAKSLPSRQEGSELLLDHLRAWRTGHRANPAFFDNSVVRWPLMNVTGNWPADFSEEERKQPYHFLKMTPTLEAWETYYARKETGPAPSVKPGAGR